MTKITPDPLIDAVTEALELLGDYNSGPALPSPLPDDPLPSLLEQCETLCARAAAEAPLPVRSLHHFACTGGTLISKCIAAQPNTVLLSEIDPLSTLHLLQGKKPFFPTDILGDLRVGVRQAPDTELADVFLAGLERMRDLLAGRGQALVVRDHPHSQFCTGVDFAARPTLHRIIADRMPLLSVVTLRHPLESFLSLDANGWRHFTPFTLEEYSQRYLAFLAAHTGLEQVRYEDFVAAPDAVTAQICDILDLPFDDMAIDHIDMFRLSGDSGRSGTRIAPRTRRTVPDAIAAQIGTSSSYGALCQQTGYDP